MSTSAIKKLGIKAGMQVVVLNAPAGLLKELGELPVGVTLKTTVRSGHPFILTFVHNKVEVDRLGPMAIDAGQPEGALWFAYPKKSGPLKTDITRDAGWKAVFSRGYRPVTQVALNQTWTGYRFRPSELVKKR